MQRAGQVRTHLQQRPGRWPSAREVSPETSPAGTWIMGLQLPEPWENKCLLLTPPVCGIRLWQPELASTGGDGNNKVHMGNPEEVHQKHYFSSSSFNILFSIPASLWLVYSFVIFKWQILPSVDDTDVPTISKCAAHHHWVFWTGSCMEVWSWMVCLHSSFHALIVRGNPLLYGCQGLKSGVSHSVTLLGTF